MIDSKNVKEIGYNYQTKCMEIYLHNAITHSNRNTKTVIIKTNEKYFIEFTQQWLNTKKV